MVEDASRLIQELCKAARNWLLPRAAPRTTIWCCGSQTTCRRKKCRHCQRRVQISNPVAANKTEESSQSPWVQSDGIKECVIEEVVDITVTGELEEALECLLVTDCIFNSLLLLSFFDLAEVSNSGNLCLYFIDSLMLPVAIENFTLGFCVLNTAYRLLSLSFSQLKVCSIEVIL